MISRLHSPCRHKAVRPPAKRPIVNPSASAPATLPAPRESDIRDYAYHLYQQSDRAPGRDLDNWLEASACLQANIPAHQSATRLYQHIHGPDAVEIEAVTIGARTLFT